MNPKEKVTKKNRRTRLISAMLIIAGVVSGICMGVAPGRLIGINLGTDPYGVFGDHRLQWWSYNDTQNPKMGKHHYLKAHHGAYDSYILGGSEAGNYPVEALNDIFDARFYNLAFYESDMDANERYCRYLIEHYKVKNILLNVSFESAVQQKTVNPTLSQSMPAEISGASPLLDYKRYLLANPEHAREKQRALASDTYLPQSFDVFNEATGAFDTKEADVEPVGTAASYWENHPDFAGDVPPRPSLSEIDDCMKHVAAIRAMCEANDVRLMVVVPPMSQEHLQCFESQDVVAFYHALAEVTPYWDFAHTSLSQDPRYFYDACHFRSNVGKMVAAQIADCDDVYRPHDFGDYVTEENVDRHMAFYWQAAVAHPAQYSQKVPILMYHHLVEGKHVENWDVMTVGRFRQQMQALAQAGYTAVDFEDLQAYVNEGVPLPPKPVVITFDDGYTSNYKLAVPVLKETSMKATVFVIGDFMGKDTYKNTGMKIPAHFSWEQAAEMDDSGVIDIQSHGYDIHTLKSPAGDPPRKGCLQQPGEDEADYVAFLSDDCEEMQAQFFKHLDKPVTALSYPYGKYSVLSEVILAQEGVDVTLTTESGNNLLVQGLPQSLRAMNRFFIKEDTSPAALLAMLQS